MWFGITIENALAERVKRGSEKNVQWEPRYALGQLLDSSFKLQRPEAEISKPPVNGLAGLMAMAGRKGSGVKLWQAIAPS